MKDNSVHEHFSRWSYFLLESVTQVLCQTGNLGLCCFFRSWSAYAVSLLK